MIRENISQTLALLNSTCYAFQSSNGQRELGPAPEWLGSAPKKSEVFVANLPEDCYEYETMPYFEKIGRIYKLRTMISFSGSVRGYCFVQYCSHEDAKRAVDQLDQTEIRPGF